MLWWKHFDSCHYHVIKPLTVSRDIWLSSRINNYLILISKCLLNHVPGYFYCLVWHFCFSFLKNARKHFYSFFFFFFFFFLTIIICYKLYREQKTFPITLPWHLSHVANRRFLCICVYMHKNKLCGWRAAKCGEWIGWKARSYYRDWKLKFWQ